MQLKEFLKNIEDGKPNPNESNIAKLGKEDYPDGIAEYGTDAIRSAMISCTSQVILTPN